MHLISKKKSGIGNNEKIIVDTIATDFFIRSWSMGVTEAYLFISHNIFWCQTKQTSKKLLKAKKNTTKW